MNSVTLLHTTSNPARGLHLCLEQLYQEAMTLDLPLVAYAIGIASEAARQEALRAAEPAAQSA